MFDSSGVWKPVVLVNDTESCITKLDKDEERLVDLERDYLIDTREEQRERNESRPGYDV